MKPWFFVILFLAATETSIAEPNDRATGGGRVVLASAQVTERTSKGKLDACEIVYTLLFQDYIYRNGGVTMLRGSVSMAGFIEAKEKPPAILLKATAFDLIGDKISLSPLSYAYISANGKSYAGNEFGKFTCEDGGLCVGYNILDTKNVALLGSIGNAFNISITRANGHSDVSIPINLLRDKPDASQSFSACVIKLLDAVRKKIN